MSIVARTILALFLSFLASHPSLSASAIDFNTAIMESTFKIENKASSATCFIIGKPSPDGKKLTPVLITADHVLTHMQEDVVSLVLRQKGTNGWTRLEYPLSIRKNGVPLWDTHETADLAGLFVPLPSNIIQNVLKPDNLVSDSDILKLGLHPGTELLCLGYPYGLEGNAAGFPILKGGRIASSPLLPTKETKSFLFDFPVSEGNSGSPVYVHIQDPVVNGEKVVGLTYSGIMGMVVEEKKLTKTTRHLNDKGEEISREGKSTSLGLGVVVHAALIKELIDDMVVLAEKGHHQ